MGTDIHGYIEFRLHHTVGIWCGAINIGPMAERYYNLFGYLFGVRGSGDKFLPIASDRGIPPDVAEVTALAFQSFEGEEATWIGWREFRDAIAAGHSIHAYQQSKYGELRAVEKQVSLVEPDYFTAIGPLPLGPGWQLIVDLGDRLAQHYGEERIRLVVWFDS